MEQHPQNNHRNALTIVAQAEQTLTELKQKGRNATGEDVARRKQLAEALNRVPDSFVFVDGTGSMANDETAARNVLNAMTSELPNINVYVFGDKNEHENVSLYAPGGSIVTKSGGGNRHESSLDAVSEQLQSVGIGLLGMPMEPRQRTNPINVYIVTDEYPHIDEVISEENDTLPWVFNKLADLAGVSIDSGSLQNLANDFKSGNELSTIKLPEFLRAMKRAGIRIFAFSPEVNNTDYSYSPLNYLGFFWRLIAQATGGEYYQLGRNTEAFKPSEAMTRVAKVIEKQDRPAIDALKMLTSGQK